MKNYFLLILFIISYNLVNAQETSFESVRYTFPKSYTRDVKSITKDWNFSLVNLSSPLITNNIYKKYLYSLKEKVAMKYPRRNVQSSYKKLSTEDTPEVITTHSFAGNVYDFNGVPNDNTLSVSNNSNLISAVNTNIYFYNSADTMVKKISLGGFADTLPVTTHLYDPKTLYDPVEDRFIFVFLSGSQDNVSKIVVGFSQTNDPTGSWNLYTLPGNVLNDTSWFDYPAIALTKDELFLTGNLLKNGGSWQTSFKQSIVWQINKHSGYSGDSLDTRLWHDIKFNGVPIRNTNPVQGGDSLRGPDIYLLSDRNFALQCDTIFIMHISGKLDSPGTDLTVKYVKADKAYGMPPDAREALNQVLATNDARVLGAFIQNGKIQFVSNTIDTMTGTSAVYHGIITNPGTDNTNIRGHILSDTVDYGYPNISYSGKKSYDDQAIITFNFSAVSVYPGFGAIYSDEPGKYSKLTVIKPGLIYINLLQGNYERWGDYSGTQRKYNDPGKVWASGSFGIPIISNHITYHSSCTWITELQTPVTDKRDPRVIDQFAGNVYPNPFLNDQITVEFDLPENDYIEISIYDVQGKLVKTLYKAPTAKGVNRVTFSVTPLNSGIYFASIRNNNKILLSKKIIKG